jgi:hypothetical protein
MIKKIELIKNPNIFHVYCDVLDYCVMQWDLGLDMFLKIL